MSESNGLERINRNEFEQNMQMMANDMARAEANIESLRLAINVQAEVLGCHRFILEKFVPAPLLEAGAKEYKEARQREIATQTAVPANA